MSSFFQDLSNNRRKLWIFLPLLLMYAASYFHRTGVPGTIFSQLLQTGLTAESIATIASAFIMVYSVSQVISGMLADKFTGVRVIIAGGLLFAFGEFLFAFCDNFYLMLLAQLIAGLGASTLFLSLVCETNRLFGRENFSSFLGIIYFVGYAGGICGGYPFDRLITVYDWRSVLLFLSLIVLVAYIIFVLAVHREKLPPPSKIPINLSPLLRIMKNPYSWMVLYCSSVNFGSFSVIQVFFGKKMLEDCGRLTSGSAAIVISCMTVCCMSLLLFMGFFIKFIGNRRKPMMITATMINLFTSVMMIVVLTFDLPKAFLIVGFILYAVASAGTMSYTLTAQELNPKEIMTLTTGFNNMGCYFFVASTSLLVGKILDRFLPENFTSGNFVYPIEAYRMVFFVLLGLSAVGSVLMLFLPETRGHYIKLKLKK